MKRFYGNSVERLAFKVNNCWEDDEMLRDMGH